MPLPPVTLGTGTRWRHKRSHRPPGRSQCCMAVCNALAAAFETGDAAACAVELADIVKQRCRAAWSSSHQATVRSAFARPSVPAQGWHSLTDHEFMQTLLA